MTGITDHLGEIRVRVAQAATLAGRDADSITLVAITKGHPAAAARSALRAGLRHLGENYLQEALPKIADCDRDAVWHFTGGIQSNKTREIAASFAWVQTVTSGRIAERLSAQRPHYGDALQVCIQLQPGMKPDRLATAGEPERAGCPRSEVAGLAEVIAGLPRLKLRGLMLVPYAGLDESALLAEYRGARAVLDGLNAAGYELDTLSMGMSGDFETAIAGGSTMIRIGTALFGQRA